VLEGDQDRTPEELVADRMDPRLLLVGWGLFLAGVALTFIDGWDPARFWSALGLALAACGVLCQNALTRRVAMRLRPGRIGPFSRWWQQSNLSGAWFRPSVIRRAVRLFATDDGGL
jgi:hypothetical protein